MNPVLLQRKRRIGYRDPSKIFYTNNYGAKPLGDTIPNMMLPIEKIELNPKYTPLKGGGDVRMKTHITKLDMTEPSNLGYNERNVNKETFIPKMTKKTKALVPEKNIDEMSSRDILGKLLKRTVNTTYNAAADMASRGYNYLSGKVNDYKSNICEGQLAKMDKTNSFCNYCATRCRAQENPLGINHYV